MPLTINVALHFKIEIMNPPPGSTSSYADVEFVYTPLIDDHRDSILVEILPDYLKDEIAFPRGNASAFFGRLLHALQSTKD